MDTQYPRVVRALTESPWAILPAKLVAIVEFVALKAAGVQLTDDEIEARIGPRSDGRADLVMAGSVAVIPLAGVIVPKANLFADVSGATSLDVFQSQFREALADSDVSAIALDIDSPGGTTDLVTEMAGEIRAGRAKKPIVAVANTSAASAAYWLGAQAHELVVSPSGSVGSIGVFAAHEDISAAQEKDGIRTTLISAGKYKAEGSPFEPLTDEARDAIQERVDDAYSTFVRDVARGRRVSMEAVRTGYGEGRVLPARAALNAGMVDRVDTLEATIRRLAAGKRRPRAAPVETAEPADTGEAAAFEWDNDDTGFEPAELEAVTLADQTDALLGSAERLIGDTRSLVDVRVRGRLTAAKRERLATCAATLRAGADAFDELLGETDPNRAAFIAEHAQFQRSLHDGGKE